MLFVPTNAPTRILLIDDDPVVHALLTHILDPGRYTLDSLYRGEDVPLYFRAHPDHEVALILLDMVMPHVDGFAVLSFLQTEGIRRPVLIITGYDISARRLWSYGIPPERVIHKPFTLSTITRKVQDILHDP